MLLREHVNPNLVIVESRSDRETRARTSEINQLIHIQIQKDLKERDVFYASLGFTSSMVKKINGSEQTKQRRNNVNVNDSSEILNEFSILFFDYTILCNRDKTSFRSEKHREREKMTLYSIYISPMVE